jgi:hypothetical protein
MDGMNAERTRPSEIRAFPIADGASTSGCLPGIARVRLAVVLRRTDEHHGINR